MCDYCDCRSHPEIAELSGEHEHLLATLASLRRAVAAGDRFGAGRLTHEVHDLLHDHAGREEAGVFVEMRAQVGPAYVAMFEDDHAVIHRMVDEVSGEGWRAAALELAERLGDHIWREETDLFPAAHQLLRPDQWTRIADHRPSLDARSP